MSNPDFPVFNEEEDITFHFEDIEFNLSNIQILSDWLRAIISSKNKKLSFLNYIFCSDEYLHDINMKYLNHDTLTDVITFPYSDDLIEGDVFISIDRIRENAVKLNVPFENELHRVMVHGLLHLLGLNDKTENEKKIMTKNENESLSLLNGMILDKL